MHQPWDDRTPNLSTQETDNPGEGVAIIALSGTEMHQVSSLVESPSLNHAIMEVTVKYITKILSHWDWIALVWKGVNSSIYIPSNLEINWTDLEQAWLHC